MGIFQSFRKKKEQNIPAEIVSSKEETMEDRVIAVCKTCYDPEIPVDIYSLGLIYNIDVKENNDVAINMTLTSPACPVAETLPPEIETRIKNEVPNIGSVKVDVVWEPIWVPDMMSEAAKLELGMM